MHAQLVHASRQRRSEVFFFRLTPFHATSPGHHHLCCSRAFARARVHGLAQRSRAANRFTTAAAPSRHPPSAAWQRVLGHVVGIRRPDDEPARAGSRRRIPFFTSLAPELPPPPARRPARFTPHQANQMKSHYTFITTPTADTPGTLILLYYDTKRILIGQVSEGAQRACLQRKVGLQRLSDVFLTGRLNWAAVGGLLGMTLTVADVLGRKTLDQARFREEKQRSKAERAQRAKAPSEAAEGSAEGSAEGKSAPVPAVPRFSVHGVRNLKTMFACARKFVFRQSLPLDLHELRISDPGQQAGNSVGQASRDDDANAQAQSSSEPHRPPDWKDDCVSVWVLVTRPDSAAVPRRKRSHEEYVDGQRTPPARHRSPSPNTVEEATQEQFVDNVVTQMFASDWNKDQLVEMKLHEVQQPASIYMRNEQGHIERYTGPSAEQDASVANKIVLVRKPWPGAVTGDLPKSKRIEHTVSYIFKNPEERGKFLPHKAKELGVKPGPAFRALTMGESVTTQDGSTVEPHQVLEPSTLGGAFAVLDIPEARYIAPLLARPEWTDHKLMEGVNAITWILGPGVLRDPRIEGFMRQHNSIEHIVSSSDCCDDRIALESPATAAVKLNMISAEHYPIPKYAEARAESTPDEKLYIPAQAGMRVLLKTTHTIERQDIVPRFNPIDARTACDPEVVRIAEAVRQETSSQSFIDDMEARQADIPCLDAEVIALGTGSAQPSKYRNVSGTLVAVPEYGNYLLDCGENTLGQMKRVLGDETSTVLRSLKVIWISHLHADHHLGTVAMIKAWRDATAGDPALAGSKLLIVSDEDMLRFLEEYSQVEDFGFERVAPLRINQSSKGTGRYLSSHAATFEPKETEAYGLSSIQACNVSHCKGAMAVVLNFPNGFKVAYSGDCRPSAAFAELGRGAHLLVHEATFDDELAGDALAKKHSTTAEALGIAKAMRARRIFLTHFSQRYQKIPVMNSGGAREGVDSTTTTAAPTGANTAQQPLDQIAIVAFDYMRVKMRDFAKVERLRPALLKLFEEVEGEEHQ